MVAMATCAAASGCGPEVKPAALEPAHLQGAGEGRAEALEERFRLVRKEQIPEEPSPIGPELLRLRVEVQARPGWAS